MEEIPLHSQTLLDGNLEPSAAASTVPADQELLQLSPTNIVPSAAGKIPRRRKKKVKDDTFIERILTLYNRVLEMKATGSTLTQALSSVELKYGSSWLAYRNIAELYILDRAAFYTIYNPKERLREMGRLCKLAMVDLERRSEADSDRARIIGLILK